MYRSHDAATLAPAAGARAQAPGWQARLALGFARRGGRTVLAWRRRSGPLAIQKPLYPEGPICHAIILHPPGGIAAGDSLEIDLDVQPGAHAVVTTPGATKWYKASPTNPSTQAVTIALGEAARIDWLPQDNIYFDDSHARQRFVLRLAEGATALGWDAALLGRRASGESWRGAHLHNLARIVDAAGQPLWEERQAMGSGDPILAAPQGLDGLPAYGTLWAAGPACTPDLAQSLAPGLPYRADLRAGATALPGGVLLVRAVAAEAQAIRELFIGLWLRLRPVVHSVPARPLRLWAT